MRVAPGILVAVLLMIPRTSPAQTANRSSDEARILLEVNLLGTAASLAKDREFQSRSITFGEVGSSFATYPKPSRATPFAFVDVGGSFTLNRWTGFGVNYSRAEHEDVAALKATIPHPTFFSAAATNTGATGEPLTRTEAATHLFFAITPFRTSRVEWRIVGGPSILSFKADMVREVLYVQTYDPLSPQQTVTISGFATSKVEARTLGFNVGTDVTFFLTNLFGVGGGFRYSDGTVDLDQEPLSKLQQEIRVGSTQVFLGVRFRLGV